MNILIANTHEFNPEIGGVERVSTILAREFQQLGHKVYFLACRKSEYSKEYNTIVHQTILTDNIKFNSVNNIQEFCFILEDCKIEIIVNQAGHIETFSSLCFKAAEIYQKAKVISVIHIDPIYRLRSICDLSTSILPGKHTYKNWGKIILLPYRILKAYISECKIYNFIYNNSDSIVLLSDRFRKDFKSITTLNSYDKLHAISNPFPYEIISQQEVKKKENKILYLGRIDYGQKRVDRILNIWSKLASDFPDWSLDIVGDGPLKQELIELVKVNKIERVNFIDFAEPIEYYKKAQFLCMTSTFEGFGMVLIEAAFYGCIPIAFKSFSSLPDIIDDGENGFMIKPYSISDYEKKIRSLLEDEKLRRKIQLKTMNIPKKFESKTIVQQWIDLFEELSDKKPI